MRRVLCISACLLALAGVGLSATASAASPPYLRLQVLSNRADLISGSRALVRLKADSVTSRVKVTLRRGSQSKDISRQFRRRRNGIGRIANVRLLGLGKNLIVARNAGSISRAKIINHPSSGPLFAGPQIEPWTCQDGAVDAGCHQPAEYTWLYRSTDSNQSELLPYDPANPPGDVATAQTDRGVEVPFIVRQERGYEDRDEYRILTLYQPGEPWKAWAPQPQWNHKVLVTHGGGCDTSYSPGRARLADYSGTFDGVPAGALDNSYVFALGRGFAVLSTALDNTGHNCNIATGAESILMAKERLIEAYGRIRYTIGTGCSGGSLAQQWISNAYPGIYQGILPQCSFPDALTTAAQFADYHLLRLYFEDPSHWGPGIAWTPAQFGAVEGHPNHANAVLADEELFKSAVNPNCGGDVPAEMQYNAATNPGGTRCDVQDFMINMFGPRPRPSWTATEAAAGHGFAGLPLGNVGIQYGLGALQSAQITPGQFVDLNASIGGLSIDTDPIPQRVAPDLAALSRAYRTGAINHANNLDTVAIINLLGPDPGAAHDSYRAFAVRDRIDREFGDHDNHVIFSGPLPLIGDSEFTKLGLVAIDRWLSAVESDHRRIGLADKIAADRPADVHDICSDGNGNVVSAGVCPAAVLPVFGTPRTVAGDALTTETNQCLLKPLLRSDYLLPFTDPEWARMQATFPDGVCDYSKPPLRSRDTVRWLRYGRHDGSALYGGRRLGRAPRRSGLGMSSRSFRGWLGG